MAVILETICETAGISWEELPKGLEIHRRYKEGTCYTFYLNTTQAPLSYTDISLEPLETKIFYCSQSEQ